MGDQRKHDFTRLPSFSPFLETPKPITKSRIPGNKEFPKLNPLKCRDLRFSWNLLAMFPGPRS